MYLVTSEDPGVELGVRQADPLLCLLALLLCPAELGQIQCRDLLCLLNLLFVNLDLLLQLPGQLGQLLLGIEQINLLL